MAIGSGVQTYRYWRMKMIVDVRSPVSGYIMINGYTIYVEVSEATDNKPHIRYWGKGEEDDGS